MRRGYAWAIVLRSWGVKRPSVSQPAVQSGLGVFCGARESVDLAIAHRLRYSPVGLARTVRYPSRLVHDGPLRGDVARLLRGRHSPEQVSVMLC